MVAKGRCMETELSDCGECNDDLMKSRERPPVCENVGIKPLAACCDEAIMSCTDNGLRLITVQLVIVIICIFQSLQV
ncbi:hypothetical protein J6590_056161 [Homalodisca vitripennis]|nr:hypothetical protein J6590_056161 [Homalodisca vitripennis]